MPFKLYGEVGLEGDKSRDIKKEFIFDFSYWSADSNDSHFVSQDQVCAKSLKLIFWEDTLCDQTCMGLSI